MSFVAEGAGLVEGGTAGVGFGTAGAGTTGVGFGTAGAEDKGAVGVVKLFSSWFFNSYLLWVLSQDEDIARTKRECHKPKLL